MSMGGLQKTWSKMAIIKNVYKAIAYNALIDSNNLFWALNRQLKCISMEQLGPVPILCVTAKFVNIPSACSASFCFCYFD